MSNIMASLQKNPIDFDLNLELHEFRFSRNLTAFLNNRKIPGSGDYPPINQGVSKISFKLRRVRIHEIVASENSDTTLERNSLLQLRLKYRRNSMNDNFFTMYTSKVSKCEVARRTPRVITRLQQSGRSYSCQN